MMKVRIAISVSISCLLIASCSDQITTPGSGGTFSGPPANGIVYWGLVPGHDAGIVYLADTNGNKAQFVDSAELQFSVGKNTFLTQGASVMSPMYVHDADGSVLREIDPNDANPIVGGAVSPDGSYIAVREMKYDPPDGSAILRLQSRDGSTSIVVDSAASAYGGQVFSTDAKYLVYSRFDTSKADGLSRYTIETGARETILPGISVEAPFTIGPDNTISYMDRNSKQLSTWRNGTIQHFPDRTTFVWSPDGSRIASTTLNALLVSTNDGKTWQTLVSSSSVIVWPSWSPDGSRIVYGKGTGTPGSLTGSSLYEYDLRTNRERKLADNGVFGYYMR